MAIETANIEVKSSAASNETGYRSFELGGFKFERDEYLVYIRWEANGQKVSHTMSADAFLRALMRDAAWGFFYGWVNFDHIFGTRNLYGQVQFYAGKYHPAYYEQGLDIMETFDSPLAMETCQAMLGDWCNEGFDPFQSPDETGVAWLGKKNGNNLDAIGREREACQRMPGMAGDIPLRTDENGRPINRAFVDVPQDQPELYPEPGFEDEVHAHNLYAYLSRSQVTWNPSVTSVCKESLFCPTTEEYILPITHGNDRIEWFVQLSGQIEWDVQDKMTGAPRAKVIMKAGDVAAMPADIRHRGYAKGRSMLLVWENADPDLPRMYEEGELPPSLIGDF